MECRKCNKVGHFPVVWCAKTKLASVSLPTVFVNELVGIRITPKGQNNVTAKLSFLQTPMLK